MKKKKIASVIRLTPRADKMMRSSIFISRTCHRHRGHEAARVRLETGKAHDRWGRGERGDGGVQGRAYLRLTH